MVSVLRDSIEAGEEGRTERAQTEHGFGQAAGLGLDGAGDVHLEERTVRRLDQSKDVKRFFLHPKGLIIAPVQLCLGRYELK